MPILHVLPATVADLLEAERVSLKILADIEAMASELSAQDLAEIHMAQQNFPFNFNDVGIVLAASPATRLLQTAQHEALHARVTERIATLQLQAQANPRKLVPSYTLNPVDENVWVAVQQRLDLTGRDPNRQLLSSNRAFFDALIAQLLHTHTFEQVCSTSLFTCYLGSLNPSE